MTATPNIGRILTEAELSEMRDKVLYGSGTPAALLELRRDALVSLVLQFDPMHPSGRLMYADFCPANVEQYVQGSRQIPLPDTDVLAITTTYGALLTKTVLDPRSETLLDLGEQVEARVQLEHRLMLH